MATNSLTRLARIFMLALALAALSGMQARASALTTDLSDLWWNPSESGWGVQLAHRGQVIFATMYNYDAAGKPTWSTAALRPSGAAWSGDLYVTTGPWFGAATFDPNAVGRRKAGVMTFSSADGGVGTLTYSLDAVSVSKSVERQYLDDENYSGIYGGLLSWKNTCTGTHENIVDVTVTQVAKNVSVNWFNQATHDSCSFAGRLSQEGQTGRIVGTFQCGPVHDDGTFEFQDMRVTPYSLTGQYISEDGDSGCRSSGYLAVARRR